MRRTAIVAIVAALVVGSGLAIGGVAAEHPSAGETAPTCEFPYTVVDATGEAMTLDGPPERVVTTGPSAAQTIWEIGAQDRVVGLTEHANYLDGADERAVVSGEDGFLSTERIVDAEPDLVLAPNATGTETVDQLREAGLTVYHFSFSTSLADVMTDTARTGELVGACEGASETLAWMDDEISTVERAVESEERPTVLYTFFGLTAGTGTHIDDLIRTAGGENVATAAGIEGYGQISDEIVIDTDPDWIVVNSEDPAVPDSTAFNETTAVREDRIVTVDIDHINQPAPWNVHAVVTLVEAIHPDAYAAANASTNDDAAEDTDSGATDATDEEEPLPGFGAVVAIIALLGVGIGIRQRA